MNRKGKVSNKIYLVLFILYRIYSATLLYSIFETMSFEVHGNCTDN